MGKFLKTLLNVGKNLGSVGLNASEKFLNTSILQNFQRQQMDYQAKLARQQYDYELKQESPVEQRKRLEMANLNPALMYGGSSASGVQASIGTPSPGPLPSGQLGTSLLSGLLTQAQIRNLDQNTAKQKTEADYNRDTALARQQLLAEKLIAAKFDNVIKQIDAIYHEEKTIANLDHIEALIDRMQSQTANDKTLTQIHRDKVNAYISSLTAQVALWREQAKTEGTRRENLSAEAGYKRAKTETEDATRAGKVESYDVQNTLNLAKTAVQNASVSEIKERIKNYESQRDKISAEIERLAKQNDLSDYHIKEIRNNIGLRWATFGVQTVETISKEARHWFNPLSSLKDLRKENRYLEDLLQDKDIFFAD